MTTLESSGPSPRLVVILLSSLYSHFRVLGLVLFSLVLYFPHRLHNACVPPHWVHSLGTLAASHGLHLLSHLLADQRKLHFSSCRAGVPRGPVAAGGTGRGSSTSIHSPEWGCEPLPDWTPWSGFGDLPREQELFRYIHLQGRMILWV